LFEIEKIQKVLEENKDDKVARRELENIVESQIRLLNHFITDSIYSGSKDVKWFFNGEEKKIGLRREEGDPILDSRVIDGFKVKFKGNKLCITYQSEIRMKEVHKGGKFESEMEGVMADIVKFLKKEYKTITKNSLSLKALGEVDIFVQPVSRTRTDLRMYQEFEITSLNKKAVISVGLPSEDTTRDINKKFLAMGREKAKKPSNVTRPDEKKKE
jgi:hypothetical protein